MTDYGGRVGENQVNGTCAFTTPGIGNARLGCVLPHGHGGMHHDATGADWTSAAGVDALAHSPAAGVWCAFTWDWNYTEVVAFATEVEALRWAIDNHGEAVFLPYGTSLTQARSGQSGRRVDGAS